MFLLSVLNVSQPLLCLLLSSRYFLCYINLSVVALGFFYSAWNLQKRDISCSNPLPISCFSKSSLWEKDGYLGFSGFPGSWVVKNPSANAGDTRDGGSIPGSGGPPGEGNGNPLQYSCLENPVVRGAWSAAVHRVAKRWTQLIDSTAISGSHSAHHRFLCLFSNSTFIFLGWTPKEEN